MGDPIFTPGDQKVFGQAMIETPDDTHVKPSPRIVNGIWILLTLFFVLIGVLCSLFVEFLSGVFVIVVAGSIAALLVKAEVSRCMMVRRMRKRAE